MKRTPLRRSRMGSKAKGSRYATSAQKRAILKAQEWLCAYCQGPLDYEGAAIDHVLAWAKGGRTATGWTLVCHHKALLFEEHEQGTLEGGSVKKPKGRVSFFKRLAYARGSPVADSEHVLIAVRRIEAETARML